MKASRRLQRPVEISPMTDRVILVFLITLGWTLTPAIVAVAGSAETERAKKFVAAHEAKIRPLEVAGNLAWWNANITGSKEDFKKKEQAQNRIDEALADAATFKEVKQLKEFADTK